MKKIGILGSGEVGKVLADGFLKLGHEVMRGSRDAAKLEEWRNGAGARAKAGTFAEAAHFGDVIVLAVKGVAAEKVLDACKGGLDGKTVLDTTNPIAEEPPENGVLKYFTGPNESLMERLQKHTPNAHFVKAFSCVGSTYMTSPKVGGLTPTMFICGDDEKARAETTEILAAFGWETEDMGSAVSARGIEPLCILWCIPGLQKRGWSHAFKLLKG
jgi:predicted dinucleotide-binding enzyme